MKKYLQYAENMIPLFSGILKLQFVGGFENARV